MMYSFFRVSPGSGSSRPQIAPTTNPPRYANCVKSFESVGISA